MASTSPAAPVRAVSASNEIDTGTASNRLNITPRIQANLAISNGNGVDSAVTSARVQMTLPTTVTASLSGALNDPQTGNKTAMDGLAQ